MELPVGEVPPFPARRRIAKMLVDLAVFFFLHDLPLRPTTAIAISLAMTTPGDTSMATLEEVERLVRGGAARIAR